MERFHQYSLLQSRKHYHRFQEGKFWLTMQNALIPYDFALKPEAVKLIMCDDFYQGAYLPRNDDKILLCANTLMEEKDFNNALQR